MWQSIQRLDWLLRNNTFQNRWKTLLLSDKPLPLCPGTSTDNFDKQEFTCTVCRYNGQSNVFWSLSHQNMLQAFLSAQMQSNWNNVPRHDGGIPHYNFGRRWSYCYTPAWQCETSQTKVSRPCICRQLGNLATMFPWPYHQSSTKRSHFHACCWHLSCLQKGRLNLNTDIYNPGYSQSPSWKSVNLYSIGHKKLVT